MENERMTLKGFVYDVSDLIRRFERHWTTMHSAAPELYPRELPIEEWDEQFRAFAENEQ